MGLWLGNSFIDPKLSMKQLAVIALICTPIAFIPSVGGLLSLFTGAFLIYRLSDLSWGSAYFVMFIANTLGFFTAIAVRQLI